MDGQINGLIVPIIVVSNDWYFNIKSVLWKHCSDWCSRSARSHRLVKITNVCTTTHSYRHLIELLWQITDLGIYQYVCVLITSTLSLCCTNSEIGCITLLAMYDWSVCVYLRCPVWQLSRRLVGRFVENRL